MHRALIDGIRPRQKAQDLRKATIAVVGLEQQGLSLSVRAASRGFQTIGFDADEVKIAQLESSAPDILAPEDAEIFKNEKGLSVTADTQGIAEADIFILCPSETELESSVKLIAEYVNDGKVVIVASPVRIGMCEHILLPILEKGSEHSGAAKAAMESRFFFAYAPLDLALDRQVIGARDDESLSRVTAIVEEAFGTSVSPLRSIKEAESVRMVEAAFKDVTLALSDELAVGFDRLGIDLVNVLKTFSPQKIALPGIKERSSVAKSMYIGRSRHEHELEQRFLGTAHRTIARMPEYAIKTLSEALRESNQKMSGTTIAQLGLARTKDGTDIDESPALEIWNALKKKGADVRVFDPFVPDAGRDIREALTGAQAAIITSNHSMFCNLTPRHFEEFGVTIVVDACNCLDKSEFEKSSVLYRGIGRG